MRDMPDGTAVGQLERTQRGLCTLLGLYEEVGRLNGKH